MRSLLRPVWILLALIVLAVAGAFLYIDRLLVTGIERGGTYALGVDTTLRSLSLGIVSGNLSLSGLTVANPEGFKTPHFLSLDHAKASVRLRSLMEDTIEVPLISLEGLEMSLERREGRTNYGAILENLGKFEKEESSGKKPAPETRAEAAGGSKKFVIRELVLRDVTGRARLLPSAGKLSELELKVPEIRLRDVGSGSSGGTTLAGLAGVITKAVLEALAKEGAGSNLALAREIQGRLAGLRDVKIDTSGMASQAKEALGGEVQKRLGGAGEKGAELLKGLGLGGREQSSGEK